MDLRHLGCFIAMAEELHFGRAAEKLNIEQSPLAHAISDLEKGLGVTLFVRTAQSIHLTREGQLLLERVPRRTMLLPSEQKGMLARPGTGGDQLRRYTFSETELSIIQQRRRPSCYLGVGSRLERV